MEIYPQHSIFTLAGSQKVSLQMLNNIDDECHITYLEPTFYLAARVCPHILTPADVLAQEGEHVALNFLLLASSCLQLSCSRRRRSSGPEQAWKVGGR